MAAHLWLEDENSAHSHSSKDDVQDLLVFGYACKIFRNDEKALYVDKGRHLIPWMGDDRLMIDRYDGRGHLYDLSSCDSENVEKKEISDGEDKIEKMCDEERYLELNIDIAEKTVYEEEEWKRYQEALHTGYNAVGFSYEQPRPEDDIYHRDVHQTEEEKPFIPSQKLNIPNTIELPPTVKMNAVIEKTAKFIAEHGAQMEIVLKAKQAGNSQFDFLDYKSALNRYYKFMVNLIKSGKYVPKTEVPENQEAPESTDHHEHGYLHKSLDTTKVEPIKSIKMPSVSIHDTPYGQLVNSIKKHHKEEALNTSLQPPPIPPYIVQKLSKDKQHTDELQDGRPDRSRNRKVPAPPGTEPVDLPIEKEAAYGEEKCPIKSEEVPLIIPPPPDVQPIIDRMAMYVAKNGSEFEMVVKSKNDARFEFLNDWHVHFPYYHYRKMMHLEEISKEKKEKEEAHAALTSRGVSFSIKTRSKEPEAVAPLKKPFFDYGSSDDEGDSDSQKDVSASQSPLQDTSDKTESNQDSNNGYVSGDALDDIEDKKLAEDRLMNRLATIAREKLAQTSKEKQIQAERKRKAAMFISLLKEKAEPPLEENEKTGPIVFDYGHKSLDNKAKSPENYCRGSSPPLSFSKQRRSRSKSPPRKNVYSYTKTSESRSPFISQKHLSKHHSNRPWSQSPKLSKSSKSRSRSRSRHSSPRSASRKRKSSRSRSHDRLSKMSSSKQSTLSYHQRDRKSKEKLINEDNVVNLPDIVNMVIKQEKIDPSFEKSAAFDYNITIISNSKEATVGSSSKRNEIVDARDVVNLSEHKEMSKDDDDDDVEIIELPPKSEEPKFLVDLTQIETDSEDEKLSSKRLKNLKRKKSHSRSPVGRKRYRRTKSPISRRSLSPYSRRKSSSSCSPKRSRYLHSKSSKRHRSRSRSPKHGKRLSRSPKHRCSRSVKKRKSRSVSLSKKSKSPNRKRSRTPKAKKKKNKSPSRSPKPNKKKKNKDKQKDCEKSKTLPDIEKSTKDKMEEKFRQLENDETENRKLSNASAETSQEVLEYGSSSRAPPKNLLNKVRAMLKASRDVLKNDEDVN